MLRRVITCLLLGAFCCSVVACSSKPAENVTKMPTKTPVEAAKDAGKSPVEPAIIE